MEIDFNIINRDKEFETIFIVNASLIYILFTLKLFCIDKEYEIIIFFFIYLYNINKFL